MNLIKINNGLMELKLSQSCLPFPLKSSASKANTIFKNFTVLPKRWKHQIQELSLKGQSTTNSKQILVHVVKEGETLSSISKLYGVTIYEIAAVNKDIVDVDLVFEGQQVDIPSYDAACSQTCNREKIRLPRIDLSETNRRLRFYGKDFNRKMFSVLSLHHLPYARHTGYFLVLVPLIAFCIICIMRAFHHRAAGDKKDQAVDELHGLRHGSKSRGWRSALRDLSDPDASDTDSRPDIDNVPDAEDQQNFHSEDVSRDFTKLEGDYQKFLSECGMSKWGYWRGGSSK